MTPHRLKRRSIGIVYVYRLTMKKERKPHQFIIKPYYPGGSKAMSDFVAAQIKYPEEALRDQIEGVVVLVIDINHQGKVVKTRIKQSVGHGCDEEAQRVAMLLKFRLDKVVRRGRTIFHKTINIRFKLPPEKPKTIIQYEIKKKETSSSSEPKTSSGYHYTIEW